MYRAKDNFNVPMKLLIPEIKKVKGTTVKEYPKPEEVSDDFLIFGSFKTFGGTEQTLNGVYSIVDTATVEAWYRPDITSVCRLYLPQSGKTYEVLGDVENIEMRNQFVQFKVRRVGGIA